MLTATLVMYAASGTHWILNCYTVMREIRNPAAFLVLPFETLFGWSLITTIMVVFTVRVK